MKKVWRLLVLVTVVVLAAPAALALEAKVGVLDLNQVLEQSEAGKVATAELAALVESKQRLVDEMGAVIDKLNLELLAKADSLPQNEREAKQAELEQLIADYQQTAAQAEAEIQGRAQELQHQILAEIGEVLRFIGERDGYMVILDVTMVHYYSPVSDITAEVIRTYNEARN